MLYSLDVLQEQSVNLKRALCLNGPYIWATAYQDGELHELHHGQFDRQIVVGLFLSTPACPGPLRAISTSVDWEESRSTHGTARFLEKQRRHN